MWTWIKSFFSKVLVVFKELVKAALPEVKQIIIGQLSNFAEKTVNELQNTDLSNDEKRKQAFDKIKQYAILHSIDAKDSIINLVIELVIQKVKV